jgi:hypothetical protein
LNVVCIYLMMHRYETEMAFLKGLLNVNCNDLRFDEMKPPHPSDVC